MTYPELDSSDVRPVRTSALTHTPRRPSHAGLLAGAFGIVFGFLGIFSIGLFFVPLAAVCSLIGLVRAASSSNSAGVGVSLLGGVLTVFGAMVSPTVWALVAGGILAGLFTQDTPTPATRPSQSAQIPPVPRPALARQVQDSRQAFGDGSPPARTDRYSGDVRTAGTSEVLPEPFYILSRDQRQVVQLGGLMPARRCAEAQLTGRVVRRAFDDSGVVPRAFTIETADGVRELVSINPAMDDYSRAAAGWVVFGLQTMLVEGQVVSIGIKRCGVAGRTAILDSIMRVR